MADPDLLYFTGTSWVSLSGPTGPQGPAGPTQVSTDAGNTAKLGTDGLLYVGAAQSLPIASATVLGGVKIGSGVTVAADGTISVSGGGTGAYLPLAGGTMTGTIRVPDSINAVQTASGFNLIGNTAGLTVRYNTTSLLTFGINTVDSAKPINLPGDPTANLHAATKQYVDGKTGAGTYLPLTGGTMTGNIGLPSADPLVATHATHKGYVDAQDAKKLNLTGGTMTGPINLPADPVANLQAATKQYVDNRLATVTGTYLDTRGGAMTGPIRFTATASPSGFNGTDVYMYYDTAGNFRVQMPSGKNGYRIDNATGVCTFQYLPESSQVPSTAAQLTNKKYVDDTLAAAPTGNTNTVTAVGATAPATTGRKVGDLWIEV
jgi:hypothetical protein